LAIFSIFLEKLDNITLSKVSPLKKSDLGGLSAKRHQGSVLRNRFGENHHGYRAHCEGAKAAEILLLEEHSCPFKGPAVVHHPLQLSLDRPSINPRSNDNPIS
jgi:hypothetical protein